MAATQVAALLLRLAIGGLFVYSGAVKIWEPQTFALAVQHYEMTSWTVSVLIAVYLPWLEVLAGAALLLRRVELGALVILAALCLVFLGAIGSARVRGLDISCGCFGKESGSIKTNFPLLIAQDLALLASVAFLLVRKWRDEPRDPHSLLAPPAPSSDL